jgi:hypothetical protein
MKILDIYAIQEMWKEDAKIDPDDLHNESLKIPELHAKYYEIYSNLLLLKKKCEIYNENPLGKKVKDTVHTKEHLLNCLNSDEEVSRNNIKTEIYNVSLAFLQDIIKMLHSRTYQIKNSIDYSKFLSGQ